MMLHDLEVFVLVCKLILPRTLDAFMPTCPYLLSYVSSLVSAMTADSCFPMTSLCLCPVLFIVIMIGQVVTRHTVTRHLFR
jgi:hypothetical protein